MLFATYFLINEINEERKYCPIIMSITLQSHHRLEPSAIQFQASNPPISQTTSFRVLSLCSRVLELRLRAPCKI